MFAVAKLLETGLVNLSRVEILWRPVTAHLLEVCEEYLSLSEESVFFACLYKQATGALCVTLASVSIH